MSKYTLWGILKTSRRVELFTSTKRDLVQKAYQMHLKMRWRDPVSGERIMRYAITREEIHAVRPNRIPGRVGRYKPDTKLV